MALKEGLGRFFQGATGAGSDILQMMLMEKLGIFGNRAAPQGDTLPPLPTKRQRPTMGPGLYGMPPFTPTSRTGFGGVRRGDRRWNEEDERLGSSGGAYPI